MPRDVEKPDFNTWFPMFSIPSLTLRAYSLVIFRDYFKIFYQHFMYLCRRISEIRSAEGKPFQGIRGRSPVVGLKKHKQQKNWTRNVLREKQALLNVMKKEFVLGFQYACHLWRRTDLEARPFNIIRVAQVLTEAGIEVFEVDIESNCLSCAPRPLAVREALTGEYTADYISGEEYPPEIPGAVLKLLAQKGVVMHSEKNL